MPDMPDNEKESLIRLIKDADKAYYELDDPLFSDQEYDNLRNTYIKKYGEDDLNYVPGRALNTFVKFTHPIAVTSLDKVKEDEPDKLKKEIERLSPVILEPKFDGLTIVAYPNDDGKTCKFVTRGSGDTGEVLPNFISKYENECCNDLRYPVRGEVYIKDDVFQEINEDYHKKTGKYFSNPRNAAAGILRNIDRSEYIDRLTFTVYDVIGYDKSETSKIDYIKKHTNFDTVSVFVPEDNTKIDVTLLKRMYNGYTSSGIPIDGIVIKSNTDNSLSKFGYTGHHPKNAIAFKVANEEFTTIIRSIEWQLGKQFLTPRATFDAVEIDGTIIQHATIHNANTVKAFRIRENDTIKIVKANEVIPYIVDVIHTEDSGKEFEIPTVCPSCGKELQVTDTGQLYCGNDNCKEKIIQNMNYIGSKKILDIPGLSIETCRKIYEYLYNKNDSVDIFDFLSIELEDIKKLQGFKDKSSGKLYDSIQHAIQSVDMVRFIAALCVPNIGITVATALAKRYYSTENLLAVLISNDNDDVYNDMKKIDTIGSVSANSICSDKFLIRLNTLMNIVNRHVTDPNHVNNNTDANSINFVLTGKMPEKRSYYEKLINEAGHNVQSIVNKNTDYLVVANVDSTSSKTKKAKSLGIKIIGCDELINLLQCDK